MELADTSLGLSHTPAGLSLLKYVAELPSLGVLMAERGRAGLCASRNADGSLPTLMLSPNGAAASVMNASHSEDRVRINFKGFNATRVLTLTTLDDIAGIPRHLLSYAQLCDAPAGIPATEAELLHTARSARLLPGDGGIDLAGIIRSLPDDLPFSLEIPNDEWLPKLGAEEWSRRALAAARRVVEGAF